MKVAHLLRKYDPREWGGTETAVLELVTGLRAHGVESVLFAPRLPDAPAGPDPLADQGFAVRRFHAFVPVLGVGREARAQMVRVGGNILSLDVLEKLAREPDVDVIHSHALGRLGGAARTAARLRRKP